MGEETAMLARNGELEENERLRNEIEILKTENASLKKMVDLGRWGEKIVADLTGGARTENYQHPSDVILPNRLRLQVKTSRVISQRSTTPRRPTTTKRWHWGGVLGYHDKGGEYDFLVLLGEKEIGCDPVYPPVSFEFFMVERSKVPELKTGSMIATTNDPASIRASTSKSKELWNCRRSEDDIRALALRPAKTT